MNTFVEGLSKEKLLCYFILLWGISWALGDLNSLVYYVSSAYPNLLERLFGLLTNLIGLLAGVALTLFGLKLLGMSK
jgi:hypothetical protein